MAIAEAARYAQAHLDEPLPLSRLAEVAGLSSGYFRRAFVKCVGESPNAYVERLRLEKAAFRLLIEKESVLKIALDCGYRNHETLTRAFRRHFGVSPIEFRHRQMLPRIPHRNPHRDNAQPFRFELSRLRLTRLQPLRIAYMRLAGPYEDIDADCWRRLEDWALRRQGTKSGLLLGIGHDAPGVTAPKHLRFDVCIGVNDGVTSDREIRIGALPELTCVLVTHVGPYASLPFAYPRIFKQAAALPHCTVIGLPTIEVYRDPTVELLRETSVTDIYLPISTK